MAKESNTETGASTAEMVAVRPARRRRSRTELQEAVLAIRDEADVVGSFLLVMGGLVGNGGKVSASGVPRLVEIDAQALETVLGELAMRCKKVSDDSDALELEIPG